MASSIDTIAGNSLSMGQTLADKANQTNSLSQDALDKISAANAASGTADKTGASSQLAGNYETFIKLLTTQLQNQDPLEPTDTSQFTQQLVMYSQVEQQIGSNSKLDSILSALTTSDTNKYVSYIGHSVAATSDQLALSGGAATVSYTLPDNTAATTVQVLDSNKNVIATLTGSTKTGDHNLTWDGKNTAGSQMTDGLYTFKVTAVKDDGSALTGISQYAVAPVTAVKTSSTGTQLELSGLLKVDPSTVIAIGG